VNTTTAKTRRFARIKGMSINPETIERYLPHNYSVLYFEDDMVTITGFDNAGWTLDEYVLPRIAQWGMGGTEIHEEDISGDELEAERRRRAKAYTAYVRECSDNLCEAHNMPMWSVHGEPEGPLG
jgi:hypothetical protein